MSNRALTPQASFGSRLTACSARARAASLSLLRLASRNKPRRPSNCVSGRSSMASKARRGPVTLELGSLRPEQGGQGFARQVAAGDAGIALRKRAVADADGEEPAG